MAPPGATGSPPTPHLLLTAGAQLLEGWFPGIIEELYVGGAVEYDLTADLVWYQGGGVTRRPPSSLRGPACPGRSSSGPSATASPSAPTSTYEVAWPWTGSSSMTIAGTSSPYSISQSFERIAGRAEVPLIRLHDLRHTHATLLKVSDVAIEASFDMVCDRCPIREKGFSSIAAAG